MKETIGQINSLVDKFGLSETVKEEFIKILKRDREELLEDFSRYCEREWNASEIPFEVIKEYLNEE
jgi:hypothetical protein